VLSKRNDVKVKPYAGHDMAIDLLVEVLKQGKPSLRFFGVEMVPYLDLPSLQDADERVSSHLGRDPFEASLPLCVFVIGVRKPEGIYRWTVEPVIEDGQALLRRNEERDWQALDERGAARLITQVDAWYDAFNGDSSPKSRARRSNTKS
jgi:hypothetical protein